MPDRFFTRRRFIQTSAAIGAATFLPAASFARLRRANERLNIAVIGTGGMGTHHVRSLVTRREEDNLDVIRVCDVYRRRLDRAITIIEGDESSGTMEYREVLDDPDVDAVLIATPDHWHTKIAIEAMEAGKDVYCEKPLSLTIEQALECRNAVRRTGRVLQVGPQGTSEDRFHQAQKAIGAGRIGKVSWTQGAYCRNSREGQFNWAIDPDAGPNQPKDSDGYVWWDRWLGHEWDLAEDIPWNADHFFRFRKYFAYNGGVATDLLYHKLAPFLLAISGADGEYPRRVVAAGGRYIEKDDRDIPDTFMMTVDYPSEHTVVLVSVMTNDVGMPDIIRGQYGTMEFNDGIRLNEQRAWAPEFRTANSDLVQYPMKKAEVAVEESDGGIEQPEEGMKLPDEAALVPDEEPGKAFAEIATEPRRDHMGNFLDGIREGAPLACNVDLGTSTMVAIKMGVESYRRNKVMLWDAQREVAVES